MDTNKAFYWQQLGQAIALASDIFKGTSDRGGKPYIFHCLRVMNHMPEDDPELRTIAVLHDVAEDFPDEYPLRRIQVELNLSLRAVEALSVLTHDPKQSYDDYIKKVAGNEKARKVKLADLRDNSDITRLKGLRKKDFDRLEKYHRAFVYLSE